MTQAAQSKEGRFVNQVADDAGAVAPALDRRIDGQQRDVGMGNAAQEIAKIAADVERSESDQAAIFITVRPDLAIAELHALGDVFLQQSSDEWVGKRPPRDCLKLGTVEPDQDRSE